MEELNEHKIRLKPSFFISIVISIGLIILIYNLKFSDTVIRASRGEHLAHELPDGSQVWLNADSEIRYKNFNGNDEREVELQGEAFFRVVKGGTFQLHGDYGSVTVSGTSFNVNQRKDLHVACFRGSVLVTNKNGKSVKLKAGQVSVTKDTVLTFRKFNSEREASWLTGDFYFYKISTDHVFDEVQRQYDIEIIGAEKISGTYTGYFNNKDLDETLQTIFGNLSMHYRKEGSQVVVLPKNIDSK